MLVDPVIHQAAIVRSSSQHMSWIIRLFAGTKLHQTIHRVDWRNGRWHRPGILGIRMWRFGLTVGSLKQKSSLTADSKNKPIHANTFKKETNLCYWLMEWKVRTHLLPPLVLKPKGKKTHYCETECLWEQMRATLRLLRHHLDHFAPIDAWYH